jgi:protein dithiol oxidoreductase (disulfide-forming)
MNRREFSAQVLSAGAALGLLTLSGAARAQGGPFEGTHYVRLSQPVPTAAGGKIDVVEFFSYACPHCNAFEPTLEEWTKKLPADVNFHRIPVPFLQNFDNFQKLYYSLEAMGLVETMQRKVFAAVHVERQRLDKPEQIAALMTKNGVDAAKFMDVFNSFSVQTKTRQAKQLTDAYKIDGVPAIGIQGRYYTSVSLAGSPERALAVTNYLIERARKGA